MIRVTALQVLIVALTACASPGPAPLLQPEPLRVDVTTPQATLEAVVLDALDREHWRVIRPFDRGLVVAERYDGLGKARVRLRASRGQVVLDYLSSDEFEYAVLDNGPVIDPLYNQWVTALMQRIRAALAGPAG